VNRGGLFLFFITIIVAVSAVVSLARWSDKPRRPRPTATERELKRIARSPKSDDDDTIYWAAILIGYLINDGLDTFLSATRYKDWGLDRFLAALKALDAEPVAAIIRRAEENYVAYSSVEIDATLPASPQEQARTKAYLEKVYALEAEIDQQPSLKDRLEDFASSRKR